MITGAERMCMPAPTVEQFVDAVKQTVLANKRWVSNYISLCFHTYSIRCVIRAIIPSTNILCFFFPLEKNISCFQVPPTGKGSLYIRPLLMGSGAVLGLAPAPEYTFIIFVSPVGNYFKVCSEVFFLL